MHINGQKLALACSKRIDLVWFPFNHVLGEFFTSKCEENSNPIVPFCVQPLLAFCYPMANRKVEEGGDGGQNLPPLPPSKIHEWITTMPLKLIYPSKFNNNRTRSTRLLLRFLSRGNLGMQLKVQIWPTSPRNL
ncbi:hypothetical protein CDAR_43671 [Caerostris darwini]|uniref:Uncharacterized protein n=1 Tax=Caerostris darwini TaxID=1538125 RepID=A0AAV4WGS2_9ARAC|nr:hypothetical protein CDAR_43671 [Caerostris darwini]